VVFFAMLNTVGQVITSLEYLESWGIREMEMSVKHMVSGKLH